MELDKLVGDTFAQQFLIDEAAEDVEAFPLDVRKPAPAAPPHPARRR